MLRLFVIFFGFFVCITPSYADQIAFKKSSINGTTSFYYKWSDYQREEQEISFKLSTRHLRAGQIEFKPFNNKTSNDYVYEQMKKYTEKLDNGIKIKRVRQGFELEAKGRSHKKVRKAMATLKQVRKNAMDGYVKDNYYKYMDENTIRPDHARIIQRYVSYMRPVAEAISKNIQTNDPRDVVDYALSFIQAIPYNILKSRYVSNGAGFQVPYGMLMGNKGDCDTKSVALAAILRNFYPHLRMMMVYVPGHAFVGLAYKPKNGDRSIKLDGVSFILAEPVGPNQSPLGVVSERSLGLLSSKNFTYEEVPF